MDIVANGHYKQPGNARPPSFRANDTAYTERPLMNDTPNRILVVDDEPSITEFVSYAL